MSLHNKNEMDNISDNKDNDEHTAFDNFEQFIEWCYVNKRAVTIAISVMLVHTLIFVGIIAFRTGSSTDIHETLNPLHHVSQPMPEPPEEPVDESIYMIEEAEDNIEDKSVSSENDSTLSAAYDAGLQTGVLLNESLVAVTNFFQGVNEATGASVWVRDKWDSGRERINRWIDENDTVDDTDIVDDDKESNETDTNITAIEYED